MFRFSLSHSHSRLHSIGWRRAGGRRVHVVLVFLFVIGEGIGVCGDFSEREAFKSAQKRYQVGLVETHSFT